MNTQALRLILISSVVPATLFLSAAIAQANSSGVVGDTFGEANKLRQQLLIDPIVVPTERPAAVPGSTAGTPTAYGASAGQAYVGVAGYVPLKQGYVDGSVSLGAGFGNPVDSVGVELGVNLTSIGGQNFDFAGSGTVGLVVHKHLPNGTAVAVGWSDPVKWGDAKGAKDTIYGVVTKSFDLNSESSGNKLPLTVSVGVGSGTFRSKGAIKAGDNSPNLFVGAGLRVSPEAAIVSSWTGNSLNVGGSFAPFKKTPLVINTVVTDVTNNLGNGAGLSISGGYSIQF
ncbi:hypothetical protein [Calothrix sp. NIES-3974]|uniref:hypothetical protein n=1 Tax=Calothrix sp. NIES-3974 TaxID=2005462 RepID=UPI000B6094B9|nr:hypothetical protein [Calothrix sp. NIES-3974]BAZ05980.1 hypothetical protein NIES3974_26370 [Calothrix sp. NIES-3974]